MYKRQQYDLLQKEYEYEKETYRQQSERTGLRKRVAQGLCWYPVTPGRSYYTVSYTHLEAHDILVHTILDLQERDCFRFRVGYLLHQGTS